MLTKLKVNIKTFLMSSVGILCASILVSAIFVLIGLSTEGVVYVRDGENSEIVKFSDFYGSLDDVSLEEILDKADITVSEHDNVEFLGFEGQYAEVNINRAYEVSVTHDGITEKIYPLQATVREAIEGLDVSIGDDDIVSMPLYSDTKNGDEITLKRVHFEVEKTQEEIPFEKDSKLSSLIKNGRTKVVTEGVNGLKEVYTKQMYVDGELYKEDLVEEVVLEEPVTELSIVGADVAVSPVVYEEYPLNDKGVPVTYKKLMKERKCAAYWAKPGAGMASGGKAVVGRVAVNPNVIPYGTKMYITSPDGSFVYGYCEAGDTGTALMEGIITIDVFFATKKEAQTFGIKWLNIYILEWGDKKR